MLKFTTNGKSGNYSITLPTDLKEITSDYLTNVTKDIDVASNYSLIGVCYREKISNIIMTARQNKPTANIAVVPIFIKSGKTESEFVNNLSIGEKIVVSPSQIALGHHVACPKNTLTINNFLYYVEGDGTAYQRAIAQPEYCYFLEFKLIPNCDIIGAYKELSEEKGFDNIFKAIKINEGGLN